MPAEGHPSSLSYAPHTSFLTPDWSPSLIEHAVAAGVLATGGSSNKCHYQYTNPSNGVCDTYFDDGLRGSADTRFPITSADTLATATVLQQHNSADILATNWSPPIGDLLPHDAPASDRQRQVVCSIVPRNFLTMVSAQNPVINCSECGKQFTGRYCKRNSKRHLQSVHHKEVCYCDVEGCHRAFNRSDAVLVHKRRSHGNMASSSSPK